MTDAAHTHPKGLSVPEPLSRFWGSLDEPPAGPTNPFPERSQSKPWDISGTIIIASESFELRW